MENLEIAAALKEMAVLLEIKGGVNPFRIRAYRNAVHTIEDLAAAAAGGMVAGLEGFGKKSEEKILAAVEKFQDREVRFRIDQADQLVQPLIEHMLGDERVQKLEVAGSYRRRKETVGDIDLLVQSDDPTPLMERFTSWKQVAEVVGAGDTRGSVVLKSGLEVDLRSLPEESYGAALIYFTGSKEHGVALRKRALERGLSINEYAVSELVDEESGEEGTTSTTGRNRDERSERDRSGHGRRSGTGLRRRNQDDGRVGRGDDRGLRRRQVLRRVPGIEQHQHARR